MAKQEAETIGRYAACGRDAVNIVQMCAGLAQMDERTMILPEDVAWVVQSGHYTIHAQQKADVSNRVGVVRMGWRYMAKIRAHCWIWRRSRRRETAKSL